MKHGSTKFWLCASALAACLAFTDAPRGDSAQDPAAPKRSNELTLAGLRPGRDTLALAEARYKTKYRKSTPGAGEIAAWTDECTGRVLALELGEKNVIQSVMISTLGKLLPPGNAACREAVRDLLQSRLWKTGRGLKLGDPRDRVLELYGEPNSSGPSAKGSHELELLFYAFDWAGSDVPQVMEISCDRATGRVVEITLAFPSL